ncbi:MAG: sigma-70 family RNA polymerase sigma factor [Candidatus Acidiferrales bacterium]
MSQPDDASERRERELIARIREGERELFTELIRPYERRVYVTAVAILQNEADAQDVAQEAILKAFTHLWQFRGESRFSTWLTRVTMNQARMRRRKEHRDIMKPFHELETPDEEGQYVPKDFTDWQEVPSEVLERKEVRELLVRALASLAEKYREVFVLRDVQHLSIEETAEAMGVTPGTVKTRLLRARLMLRYLLAPGLGGSWASRLPFEKGNKPWT